MVITNYAATWVCTIQKSFPKGPVFINNGCDISKDINKKVLLKY